MMKRLTIAAAALMMAAPLAPAAAQAQTSGRYDGDRSERDNHWRDNDRRDNDRRDYDRRDNDRRDNDWRDRRDNDRRGDRWDRGRHNGYYLNGRWNYGPPPAWAYGRRDFRPGYAQWRRGERLPAYYRAHYRRVDYRRERLREPPRGYHYVRDDRGEILLVGIATGVILSVLLSGN
jgi:Ni/Co efflux regulator RcnB